MAKGSQYQIPDPEAFKPAEDQKIPRVTAKPDGECKFSFSHWTQIQNFGLDCDYVDIAWLSSLLTQLKELSNHTVEDIFTDRRLAEVLRYHPIDLGGSGTTMTKEEFWGLIPEGYRNEEYEIAQFQITMSKGRVIGFFDHEWVFRVVLLDPMHNMIPSKDSNYKIRKTTDLLTPYQKLENQFSGLKSKIEDICPQSDCEVHSDLKSVLSLSDESIFVCLEKYWGLPQS